MVRGGSKKRKGPSEPENGRIQMQAESIFSCRIESSKILTDVLTCLVDSNRKDQICYFEATQECKNLSLQSQLHIN